MSRHNNQVCINSSWNNFGLSQLQYSLSNGNPARHIFFLSLQLPLHHHLLHKCQSLPLSSSASYGNHLHLKQLMVKLDNTSLPLLRWKLSSNLRLQQTALRWQLALSILTITIPVQSASSNSWLWTIQWNHLRWLAWSRYKANVFIYSHECIISFRVCNSIHIIPSFQQFQPDHHRMCQAFLLVQQLFYFHVGLLWLKIAMAW